MIFPILDQLMQLGVLYRDSPESWHRYEVAKLENHLELDSSLEIKIVHRLFVAIDLPDPVKDRLTEMSRGVPGAKWVGRNQLHLTLRFIGEVEMPKFQEIKSALKGISAQPFSMTLQGVGRFPPKRAPRVLWVGMAAQPALFQLQRDIERALNGIGFTPEARPFEAHITLARLKTPPPPDVVERFLEQHADFKTEAIAVDNFILYSSVLAPQGPTYRPESVYRLSG